jgi:hypothetical protein
VWTEALRFDGRQQHGLHAGREERGLLCAAVGVHLLMSLLLDTVKMFTIKGPFRLSPSPPPNKHHHLRPDFMAAHNAGI